MFIDFYFIYLGSAFNTLSFILDFEGASNPLCKVLYCDDGLVVLKVNTDCYFLFSDKFDNNLLSLNYSSFLFVALKKEFAFNQNIKMIFDELTDYLDGINKKRDYIQKITRDMSLQCLANTDCLDLNIFDEYIHIYKDDEEYANTYLDKNITIKDCLHCLNNAEDFSKLTGCKDYTAQLRILDIISVWVHCDIDDVYFLLNTKTGMHFSDCNGHII